MSDRARAGRPAALGSVAALVVWAGVLARVLVETDDSELIPWYLGGLALFLVVHVAVVRWPLPTPLLHLAFALQAALVLVLLSLNPNHDILTALLALECYQAAVVFSGRARLVWVVGLVSLIPVSLVMGTSWLSGLSEAFVPMAGGVVLAMFAVVSRDLEDARVASRDMVAELREAQRRLEDYAGQVDELAAIEERSRVARELQISVSTTLGEALAATQAVREARDAPDEASALLERLQALAQQALAQMRRVIAELRPAAGSPSEAASSTPPDRM
jgi:signal transduction histidine kinase